MGRYWSRLLVAVQQVDVWSVAARCRLLRWAGYTIGAECLIEPGVAFVQGGVTLGRGVYVNRGCLLDGRGGLILGDHVHLGPGVCLVTSAHDAGGAACRAGAACAAPITVGAGSWLGAGTIVIAGIDIGAGVVVASGATVIGDLPPNALYAGVPATLRKPLPA